MLAPLFVFGINLWRRLVNGWRRVFRRRVEYVRFRLTGPLPELATAPSWWQRRFLGAQPVQSVQGLRRAFERIADEPRVRGVILHIDGLQGGWATLQSLRAEITTLRAAGKRVVAYLVTPDTVGYYTACAADRIVLPPTVFFSVVGLRAQAQFLKDALAKIGVAAEVTAVSPYKSGGDTLTRAEASPEAREQLDRLLDVRYAELVRAIATGRGKSLDAVRSLIDTAPHAPGAAASLGLVDTLRYEDQLDQYLATEATESTEPGAATAAPPASNTVTGSSATAAPSEFAVAKKLVVLDWEQAQRVLPVPLARVRREFVGLVTIEGTIASGRSRSVPVPLPLVGGRVAGADSVIQSLRQAERARRVKAVVLYVNSPGGGVLASDLMWREVLRLRHKKPVVVAMGDAAASGGYYLSAPAQAIVAQPGTLTGSIGVFMLRPVLQGTLEQLGINTLAVGRGANSSFLDTSIPPTENEREAVRAMVFGYYEDFKARVRGGRNMPEEQLEPVAGGRVWLGEEALGNGLIDRLGGIPEAVLLAQELAKLAPDRRAPLVPLRGSRAVVPPEPFPEQPVAVLAQQLGELLRPQVWALMPFEGI
jgi:protease-4